MKSIFVSIGKALRKMAPIYMALLVVCGILANAGVKLPTTLQWAYEPVEQTTAYAAAVVKSLETPEPNTRSAPTEISVPAGTFWNTHVTAQGDEISYVIRIPNNMTPNMPLIVYLHEEGVANIPQLANVGVVPAADNNNIHNCVIVQPLCNAEWTVEYQEAIVRDLTQTIVAKFYCDESRVVLTGTDDSAVDVWFFAETVSNYWTAISPIGAIPEVEISNMIEEGTSCYMVCGEFDLYEIKGGMRHIAMTLSEAGANAVLVVRENADNAAVCTYAYDNDWFSWACQ